MIVIKPFTGVTTRLWVSGNDGQPSVVCTFGLEQAFNITLPKYYKRIEIDVEVTRFEYE